MVSIFIVRRKYIFSKCNCQEDMLPPPACREKAEIIPIEKLKLNARGFEQSPQAMGLAAGFCP
jgi:hypothetical protein